AGGGGGARWAGVCGAGDVGVAPHQPVAVEDPTGVDRVGGGVGQVREAGEAAETDGGAEGGWGGEGADVQDAGGGGVGAVLAPPGPTPGSWTRGVITRRAAAWRRGRSGRRSATGSDTTNGAAGCCSGSAT